MYQPSKDGDRGSESALVALLPGNSIKKSGEAPWLAQNICLTHNSTPSSGTLGAIRRKREKREKVPNTSPNATRKQDPLS